jgi:hypothetical protein
MTTPHEINLTTAPSVSDGISGSTSPQPRASATGYRVQPHHSPERQRRDIGFNLTTAPSVSDGTLGVTTQPSPREVAVVEKMSSHCSPSAKGTPPPSRHRVFAWSQGSESESEPQSITSEHGHAQRHASRPPHARRSTAVARGFGLGLGLGLRVSQSRASPPSSPPSPPSPPAASPIPASAAAHGVSPCCFVASEKSYEKSYGTQRVPLGHVFSAPTGSQLPPLHGPGPQKKWQSCVSTAT